MKTSTLMAPGNEKLFTTDTVGLEGVRGLLGFDSDGLISGIPSPKPLNPNYAEPRPLRMIVKAAPPSLPNLLAMHLFCTAAVATLWWRFRGVDKLKAD